MTTHRYGLSPRVVKLLNAEFGPNWTLTEVFDYGRRYMLQQPNVGPVAMREIEQALVANGFDFFVWGTKDLLAEYRQRIPSFTLRDLYRLALRHSPRRAIAQLLGSSA